jgi:hypothetical protein
MRRRIVWWKFTDVSEEFTASVFKVGRVSQRKEKK